MQTFNHLHKIIKTAIITMLVAMSVHCALAQSIYVNVGSRPGYRTVWVPGHWNYGRWIPGHYVRIQDNYYRQGWPDRGYRHHRWHDGRYWHRY